MNTLVNPFNKKIMINKSIKIGNSKKISKPNNKLFIKSSNNLINKAINNTSIRSFNKQFIKSPNNIIKKPMIKPITKSFNNSNSKLNTKSNNKQISGKLNMSKNNIKYKKKNINTDESYIVHENCDNQFNNQISVKIYIDDIFNDTIINYINYLLDIKSYITILIDNKTKLYNNIVDYCKNKNINYYDINNYTNLSNIYNFYIAFNPKKYTQNIHDYNIEKSYKTIAYIENNNVDIYTNNFDMIKDINNIENNLIKSIIPLNVYITWKTKNLPEFMNKNVEDLKQKNQEFNFILYDNNDCEQFIRNNFDNKVLNAYNRLKPGAYKADLWRYCIMYKYGGIYLDIKFKLMNNFKLLLLTDKEYYVKDDPSWFPNKIGLYNAVLVALPNNKIYLDCINKIIDNINKNYYGPNQLYPTGPGLFGEIYLEHKLNNNFILKNVNHRLKYKNIQIITEYKEYRKELYNVSVQYAAYWKNRDIYG
jgi:mannosyltransferase OCH1-like enzyme